MPSFALTCRTLGNRRLEALTRIKSRDDWQKLWPKPRHTYPFAWGECWKAVAARPCQVIAWLSLGTSSVVPRSLNLFCRHRSIGVSTNR